MIRGLATFFIFLAGYLAAFIDWHSFFAVLLSQEMEHTAKFFFWSFVIVAAYFVAIVWPVTVLYRASQKRYLPRDEPERVVSYRKIMERRGSWPLAYKNAVITQDI